MKLDWFVFVWKTIARARHTTHVCVTRTRVRSSSSFSFSFHFFLDSTENNVVQAVPYGLFVVVVVLRVQLQKVNFVTLTGLFFLCTCGSTTKKGKKRRKSSVVEFRLQNFCSRFL